MKKGVLRLCWRSDLSVYRGLSARLFWSEEVAGDDRKREDWQLDQWSAAMSWYLKWLEACQEVGADHRSLAERLRLAVRSAGSRRGLAPRTKDCHGAWAARYGNFAKTADQAMSVETATRFLSSLLEDEESDSDFIYDEENDRYQCPQGKYLARKKDNIGKKASHSNYRVHYTTSSCKDYPFPR